MEELLKEIQESIKTRQEGVEIRYWTSEGWKEEKAEPTRGKGTIAYTIRRIDLLQDKLKELKKDLQTGKIKYKGGK